MLAISSWVGFVVQMEGQEWGDGSENALRHLKDLNIVLAPSLTSYVN